MSRSAPILALTGATGFLGTRIAIAAADAGWQVRALARDSRRAPAAATETIVGDLADSGALMRLAEGADAVIHNAGAVKAARAAGFARVNADGAAAMARAAAATARPEAPFLLISSLAARRPDVSPYAASKAAAEAALRPLLAGRPFAILRPPAIYGPRDAATRPLFDAIRRGLAPRIGPADARFAMIHVDDAAAAALAALAAASVEGPVFEADDGAGGHTWRDLRAAAEAASGRRLRPVAIPGPLIRMLGAAGGAIGALGLGAPFLGPGKVREIYAGDWLVDPALRPPGWAPQYSLQSGFSQTLAWYREQSQTAK